jgi:hypothetical protein
MSDLWESLCSVVGHTDGRTLTTRVRVAFRSFFANASYNSCSCKDSPLAEIHLLQIHVTKSVSGQRSDCVFAEDNNLADSLKLYKKFRTCRNNGAPSPLQPAFLTQDKRHWQGYENRILGTGEFSMASMCYIQWKPEGILPGTFSLHLKQSAFQSRLISCVVVHQFWGAFGKLRKASIKLRHVCPSIHMEQLCSHRTDFHEIWYWIIFRRASEKIKVLLKLGEK